MANAAVIRKDIEGADIEPLRDAYAKMQQLSIADNRSWTYWAGLHGFSSFDCWHHFREGPANKRYPYNLFLPWHRAYLLSWEHVVRDQNDAAVPPYWDWTSPSSHDNGIPASYVDPTAGGEPNPLAAGPVPDMPDLAAHTTRRFPGDPSELPTSEQVGQLVTDTKTFEDFTLQIEDIHDAVHAWVGGVDPQDSSLGGDMGVVATSAFDPIFWAHHCMIDRVWYLWQLEHGTTNIPPQYRGLPLEPFSLTVDDVLDIHNLGYDYATASASGPGPATTAGGSPA